MHMKSKNFEEKSPLSRVVSMRTCLALVSFAVLGSLLLGWAIFTLQLRTYAAAATNALLTAAGPVAKTWYFAEGRVGKGFREYLAIDNPDTNVCTVDITYLYQPDGTNSNQIKVISQVHITMQTRWTESVNRDLGLLDSDGRADNVASIVKVSGNSSCQGVVVERPIYFRNYLGISSGTNVLGANQPSTPTTLLILLPISKTRPS